MIKKFVSIIFIAVLFIGCAGKMQGVVRDSGERITVNYEQSVDHDKLHVTMPNGEAFQGKVVMVGGTTSIGYTSGNAYTNYSYGGYARTNASALTTTTTGTGNMQGVLFGNKGRTMRCNFQYADKSGFTSTGGFGFCQVSDGKTIDIQW